MKILIVNGFNGISRSSGDYENKYDMAKLEEECEKYGFKIIKHKGLREKDYNHTTMYYYVIKQYLDQAKKGTPLQDLEFHLMRATLFARTRRQIQKILEGNIEEYENYIEYPYLFKQQEKIVIYAKSLGVYKLFRAIAKLDFGWRVMNPWMKTLHVTTIDAHKIGTNWDPRSIFKQWVNYYQTEDEYLGGTTFVNANNIRIKHANHKTIEEVMVRTKIWR